MAIKSIRKEKIKDEQDMVHIRREIEIMSSLKHPHIISIYEGRVSVYMHMLTHTHTAFNLFLLPPAWCCSRTVMLWQADVIIQSGPRF